MELTGKPQYASYGGVSSYGPIWAIAKSKAPGQEQLHTKGVGAFAPRATSSQASGHHRAKGRKKVQKIIRTIHRLPVIEEVLYVYMHIYICIHMCLHV